MEWLTKINDAIEYIESNIEHKIDYSHAAEIAGCSLSRFQHMFVFTANATIAEYIRRRRMSLAAADLIHSDIKVIDLALKFGYESPEAFTRAYQTYHGVPPTSTRKFGTFVDYPRIVFHANVGSHHIDLAAKPIVRIEEHSHERVVGFRVNCQGPEGAAWKLLRKWAVGNLTDYTARRCVGCAPQGHHPKGTEHQPNEGEGFHEYVMQMLLFGDEGKDGVFHGIEVSPAPAGLYLVGSVALNEYHDDGSVDIGSSMQSAYHVMSECLAEMGGYEFDLQTRRHLEEQIFTNASWTNSSEAAELSGFKLWLPIRHEKCL